MAKQAVEKPTDELKIMAKAWQLFAPLTAAGRRRVLNYLNDRHGEDCRLQSDKQFDVLLACSEEESA